MAKKENLNAEQEAAEKKAKTSEEMQAEREELVQNLQEQQEQLIQQQENLKQQEENLKQQQEEMKKQQEEIKQKEKALREGDKTVQKMRKAESKQKRIEKIKDGADGIQTKFHQSADNMSSDLENLLSDDMKAMKRGEKTRSMEIWGIFAKHNFYMNGISPVELRTTLEDLGPTYVKIGQIMSSRTDMLPEEYCRELETLRESVKPLDSEVARAVIEQELGGPLDQFFSDFNDDPLGSASIGQAHSATLVDGTKVVIKVQRPLIADMMRKDFVMLKKAANNLSTMHGKKDADNEQIDMVAVIEELEKVTNEELDFRIEAQNTIFFKENCIPDDEVISCPTIFPELTTERIMTMTFVDGYSVSKRDRIIEDGYDPNEIGRVLLDNYMYQVLDVGTFHADPHQGNIMISQGKPYWIDFGMVGHLTDGNIKCIQDLIFAVIETDTEDMVSAIMAMGAASPKTDRAKLTEDVEALLNKYMSVTNLDELDLAGLLTDVSDAMTKHHIKVPSEYTILIRSVSAMEGVIEELSPELNLFAQITDKVLARVRQNFDVQQTLINMGKEAFAVGKKASRIPGLAADALTGINKGRVKINLEPTGYEPIMNQLNKSIQSIILAFFSCVIFFGSCLLCMTDIQPKTAEGMPVVAVFGFIFSIALAIYTLKKVREKQK